MGRIRIPWYADGWSGTVDGFKGTAGTDESWGSPMDGRPYANGGQARTPHRWSPNRITGNNGGRQERPSIPTFQLLETMNRVPFVSLQGS